MEKICICSCYNKENILNSMLLEGVKQQQGVEIELKTINCSGRKTSAAAEFNQIVKEIKSEYVVFVHQDVKFDDCAFLKKTLDFIKANPKAIVGLVGARSENGKTKVYSNMYHGLQNRNVGTPIEEPTEVTAFDEVMLGGLTETFRELPFDEKAFNGWHVFGADYSLTAIKNGYKNYVLPLKSIHKNALEMPGYMRIVGILPDEYFVYFKRLVKKHRRDLDLIVCPCMTAKTGKLSYAISSCKKKAKNKIRRLFRNKSLKSVI